MIIPDIPDGTTKADAALLYARAGIPVFPCDQNKEPVGRFAPKGFKSATTNEQIVTGWWRRDPDFNIGSPLDDQTLALDVDDTTKAKPVTDILSKTGPVQITGSATDDNPKHHRIYDVNGHDPADLITRIAELGIETKGLNKGYILLAPSTTTGPYRWVRTGQPEPLPDSLYATLTARRTQTKVSDGLPLIVVTDGNQCAKWCDYDGPITRDPGGYQYINDFAVHRATYHRETQRLILTEELLLLLDRMTPAYEGNEGYDTVNKVVTQIAKDVAAGKIGPDPITPRDAIIQPIDALNRSWTLSELLDVQITEVPMIVPGLIPRYGLGMVVGMNKSGKTSFSLQTAESIATPGGALLGQPIGEPLTVWFNEAEGSSESLIARAKGVHFRLGSPDPDQVRLRVFYRAWSLAPNPVAGLDAIKRLMDEMGEQPDVLFPGLLMRIADIKDENSSAQVQPVLNALDAFAAEHRILTIFNHHTGKAPRADDGKRLTAGMFFDRVRGSSVIGGSVDFAIGLDRYPDEIDTRINVLLRDGATRGFDATFDFPIFVPPGGSNLIVFNAPADKVTEVVLTVLSAGLAMTLSEVGTEVRATGLKASDDTVDRRLRGLIDSGQVVEQTAGRGRAKEYRMTSAKVLAEVPLSDTPFAEVNRPAEVPAEID